LAQAFDKYGMALLDEFYEQALDLYSMDGISADG